MNVRAAFAWITRNWKWLAFSLFGFLAGCFLANLTFVWWLTDD